MALDAEALRAAVAAVVHGPDDAGGATAMQRSSCGEGGDSASPAAMMVVPAGVPVVVWSGDDRRMKRELVAWAKAVASMVVRDFSMQC
jgi:hypothetical protein